jgi:hypothetical protein
MILGKDLGPEEGGVISLVIFGKLAWVLINCGTYLLGFSFSTPVCIHQS